MPQVFSYSVAVATYKRPESLRRVLTSVLEQSVRPSLVVVADNDPDHSARVIVEELSCSTPVELRHLPMSENVGPAGAWTAAVEEARRSPDRGTWVLIVDDDDPLGSDRVVEHLARSASDQGDRIAAIGLRGSVVSPLRGRLSRKEPPEGVLEAVHYLASGGAPIYRWTAIERVGFFEVPLFFGFEDLDLGFRLREAGWALCVAPAPSLYSVADTSPTRDQWREYYKTRSLVWIFKRYLGAWPVLVAFVRSVLLGSLIIGLRSRSTAVLRARFAGFVDGWNGRLGVRRYVPGSNPAK